MILPSSRWQRVAITALLVLPLVLIVALSAPGWLVFPFLPQTGRDSVMTLLDRLIDWIKAIAPRASSALYEGPSARDDLDLSGLHKELDR